MKPVPMDLRALCLYIALVDSDQVQTSKYASSLEPAIFGVTSEYGGELLATLASRQEAVCSEKAYADFRWDSLREGVDRLNIGFDLDDQDEAIIVQVREQQLYLIRGSSIIRSYPVSTAKNGVGSQDGSNKTPLGTHVIGEKIGDNMPLGAVFVGRKFTNEVVASFPQSNIAQKDQILTRIMWLDGLEPDLNQGAGIDSHDRFIYIHGTQEEELIGTPSSKGCIRMKNKDVADLFDLVSEGALVQIQP